MDKLKKKRLRVVIILAEFSLKSSKTFDKDESNVI